MKNRPYIIFIATIIFFSGGQFVYAQEQSEVQTNPTSTATSDEQTYLREQYNFLMERTIDYEKYVETERQQFFNFLMYVGGISITMLGLFGITTFWKIKREAESTFTKYIKKEDKKLRGKIKSWVEKTIHLELGFNKKVLVVAPPERQESFKMQEMPLLNQRGINNVDLSEQLVINPDYDLVIFCLSESKVMLSSLDNMIKHQKSQTTKTPIIVYTYGNNSVQKTDELNSYAMHTLATTPLTLAVWTFNILASIARKDGEINR